MPTARGLRYDRYGGPEVLELAERELPGPDEGQVLVRVRAAGLNPFDAKSRAGRFAGGKAAPEQPVWVGYDVAGVVEAVGPGEVDLEPGDEVVGLGSGTVATLALAGPVVVKPEDLAWTDAAAWPTVLEAATRGLELVEPHRGETVLVHGGAGAVGRLAVQLALRVGARVVATAAERDHEDLRTLGALPVAYGHGWEARVREAAGDVDAVVDAAGAGVLAGSVALAGGPDRVVTLAGGDAEETGVRFSGAGTLEGKARALALLPTLHAEGVRVPVAGTFPLEDAVAAYRALDAGPRGKLVIAV